ncbi:hypothetical protein [Streptomyces sp. NPDC057702]|uniref:hypothetical protein n=1 Tax=unclassified Streptomyces TaxID=2593676 RepID=UPI00368E6486
MAALLAVAPTAPTAPAAAASRGAALAPECGDASDADFPIGTRLHAGPGDYRAGDPWRHWRLDLRNTTRVACAAIHPVALFADRAHALRPDQLRVEFHDPYQRRWRPVRFEVTDEDENVGVFDGGGRRQAPRFTGFEVPARETLTVRVRVRFAAHAPIGPASAAVTAMQRQHQDGDWVGQSPTYRFTIQPARADARSSEPGTTDDDGPDVGAESDVSTESGARTGEAPDGHPDRAPATGDVARQGTGAGEGAGAGEGTGPGATLPGADTAPGDPPADAPPQLAATGPASGPLWGLAALALGLLVGGAALLARTRGARAPRRPRGSRR